MNVLMEVRAAVSSTNVALLLALLFIYVRIYQSSKAIFTLGLMFCAGMLALHNIIAVYAYLIMAPLYNEALLPYFVAVHIAELAGVAVHLKITI